MYEFIERHRFVSKDRLDTYFRMANRYLSIFDHTFGWVGRPPIVENWGIPPIVEMEGKTPIVENWVKTPIVEKLVFEACAKLFA